MAERLVGRDAGDVAAAAARRERVKLCKELAKEMPTWRRFYVDVHGNVRFPEALQPHRQQEAPTQGERAAEQVARPARRVSPCRAARSARRAAERAAAEQVVAERARAAS